MRYQHHPRSRYPGIAVVVVLVLALLAAVGQVRAAPEAAFQSAFQQFDQALADGGSAIDRATDEFDALLKAEPASPVLMAYAGAARSLKARNTILPWKKMGYAEDGLALIDKALALLAPAHAAAMQRGTPGVLEVRFVAANTFLAMPDFMNRGARGAKLLSEVLDSPLYASAPLPFQGAVWMAAAGLAAKEKRREDAQRYLNEVISRNAPQAEQARALLKGMAA